MLRLMASGEIGTASLLTTNMINKATKPRVIPRGFPESQLTTGNVAILTRKPTGMLWKIRRLGIIIAKKAIISQGKYPLNNGRKSVTPRVVRAPRPLLKFRKIDQLWPITLAAATAACWASPSPITLAIHKGTIPLARSITIAGRAIGTDVA